jgi:hypothetical protein
MIAATASLLIVSMGLIVTLTAVANPGYIGQWYTLYQENQGSKVVYKIEAQITKVITESVKTASIRVDFRVTNNHPFGVHLTSASFWLEDIRAGKTALSIDLPESNISAESITNIYATGQVVKLYGMGYKFLVNGEIEWYEMYGSGQGSYEVGPFVKVIHEFHSPVEFTKA